MEDEVKSISDEFVLLCLTIEQAMKDLNPDANNLAVGQMVALMKSANPKAARIAMEQLLTHINPEVTITAASYLVRSNFPPAIALLKEISKGRSIRAFEAQQCLKRWEEGAIKFGV